ncbi:MAG: adenylosuccinate synthetase [Candidatus Absconditabacterales bacterium]
MKKTAIVLGLGFGDEGKGITTDYLVRNAQHPLVVRFSGGQQAGHTVALSSGQRHVFSSIGSGALRGAPSYWSKYCTLYPTGLRKERESLQKQGLRPMLYVDMLSMVTTPYDIAYNRATESLNNHGSCGLGFAATVERSTTTPNLLFAQDLQFGWVVAQKMKAIDTYYVQKIKRTNNDKLLGLYQEHLAAFTLETFWEDTQIILQYIELVTEQSIVSKFDEIIFEGSQGILLDQDHGFFPHVTRSYTTSRNAVEIIARNKLEVPDIYYITRAYQTRHGNGPMTNEQLPLQLINNENETNILNDWQGNFRTSILDLDLINFAIKTDSSYSGLSTKHLVVTCLDQVPALSMTLHGDVRYPESFLESVQKGMIQGNFKTLTESHGDCSDAMQTIIL